MRAIRIERTGGPEVLQCVDLPRPALGPDDVLVRTEAIGVGMPDVMVRKGIYRWMPRLPAVIGIESAGRVEARGERVASIAVGQRVYVNARDLPERSGGYAEYRVAPAAVVHPLPDGVDLRQAAALGNYQVAESLLRLAPPHTRSVGVVGAAGGVGSAAVQLASLRGWRAIGIAGGSEKCAFVTAQGAVATVDHRLEGIADGLRRVTDGDGVDLVLDPVGGALLPTLFAALAPLGLVVAYGGLGGEPGAETIAAMRARFGASPGLRLFSMHTWDARPDVRADLTRTLIGHLVAGAIAPSIDRTFPLDQARAAHERFEAGHHRGRIVLVP